ncbi:MAG: hypothetical protein Q7I95_04530 [Thiobacillus sp.]|nr:hypothetical protein [Thiobacillus sp.]MDZ7584098.1 hypothetical protein [Thiobacillus sp.]
MILLDTSVGSTIYGKAMRRWPRFCNPVFIEHRELMVRGIGYIDAHLLAATAL